MSQKVTVTFTTDDNVDAAKLVQGLAAMGNGASVLVQPPVYGRASNIQFVSAEQVEDVPADATA